jgi:hypothetical protein
MADELPPKKVDASGPTLEISTAGTDMPSDANLPGGMIPESLNPPPTGLEAPTSAESPTGGQPVSEQAPSIGGSSPEAGGAPGGAGVEPLGFQGNGYTHIGPGVVFGTMTPAGKQLKTPAYSYFQKGNWIPVNPTQLQQIDRPMAQPPRMAAQ